MPRLQEEREVDHRLVQKSSKHARNGRLVQLLHHYLVIEIETQTQIQPRALNRALYATLWSPDSQYAETD